MSPSLLSRLAAIAALAPLAAQNFPPPPTPSGNPTTTAKVNLGKALFWDEQMSSTRTVACGTCHIFSSGGADPRANAALAPGADLVFGTADDVHGSPGVPQTQASGAYLASAAFGLQPRVTPRLAPSVVNAAYSPELFWDGRARSQTFRDPITNAIVLTDNAALENLVAEPPVNTIEMGHVGRNWSDVATRIAAVKPLALATNVPPALATFVGSNTYPQLFQTAFGSPGVTPSRIVMAIAAYLRTLVSDQSPVDRFFLAGTPQLSLPVQRGLGVFLRSCVACHQNLPGGGSGPDIAEFRNSGVRPIAEDTGRFQVTANPADGGAFKVPDLRNAALRPRFFHGGSAPNLGAVVDFYNRGGDFHVGQDPVMATLLNAITQQDKLDLLAFLQALIDPRVQNETAPFDRPRLYSESTRQPQLYGVPSGTPAPRAVALEPPLLGNPSFTIGLAGAAPAAAAMLFVDAAADPAGPSVLGIRVWLAGTTALAVLGGPTATQTAPDGSGFASATIPVPANPLLLGLSAYCQWAVLDGTGAVQGSAGVQVTFF